jgi:hypothetical protein
LRAGGAKGDNLAGVASDLRSAFDLSGAWGVKGVAVGGLGARGSALAGGDRALRVGGERWRCHRF